MTNKEKIKKYAQKYRENNREKERERLAIWYKENKERKSIADKTRRAQAKWAIEEIECVHQWLDRLNSPRADDNGDTYSIVGRIKKLLEMQQNDMYKTTEQ